MPAKKPVRNSRNASRERKQRILIWVLTLVIGGSMLIGYVLIALPEPTPTQPTPTSEVFTPGTEQPALPTDTPLAPAPAVAPSPAATGS